MRRGRTLVLVQVFLDALVGIGMFIVAYLLRFETGFIAAPKGQPELIHYLQLAPFIGSLLPFSLWAQGAYRPGRVRSRVDELFAVFVGSLLAGVLGITGSLVYQTYFVPLAVKEQGIYEVSRAAWAIYLILCVVGGYGSRSLLRTVLERRWRTGIGLKRILIAGTSDVARHVVDKMLQHGELGYSILGFIDDRAGGDHMGYRGLPLLGTLSEVSDILRRDRVDQLYVALPLDEHVKMLELIEIANRECVEVKVVPDLLQVMALRARLEDLEGVPIININDVSLQGVPMGTPCSETSLMLMIGTPSRSSRRARRAITCNRSGTTLTSTHSRFAISINSNILTCSSSGNATYNWSTRSRRRISDTSDSVPKSGSPRYPIWSPPARSSMNPRME